MGMVCKNCPILLATSSFSRRARDRMDLDGDFDSSNARSLRRNDLLYQGILQTQKRFFVLTTALIGRRYPCGTSISREMAGTITTSLVPGKPAWYNTIKLHCHTFHMSPGKKPHHWYWGTRVKSQKCGELERCIVFFFFFFFFPTTRSRRHPRIGYVVNLCQVHSTALYYCHPRFSLIVDPTRPCP
jgi:hypothetical protein